jgi:heme/copper-type cytochrome/quinol oxidase subunit 3
MIPVEAHLVLNHIPPIGLAFGLVFFVAGLMRSSEQALRAGLRIFLVMGIAVLPVVGSGLMSATILANATWLDAHALSNHRLAGILTLALLVGLGTLSGTALFTSPQNRRAMSTRVRNAVLFLAVAGFGATVWTAYLGGTLRHTELASDQPSSMELLRTR